VGLGIFALYNIELDRARVQFEYEMDYLCSQSRMIVGRTEYGTLIMETMYVSCEGEIEQEHNFMRGPDVEKKFVTPFAGAIVTPTMIENWAYTDAFSVLEEGFSNNNG